MSPLGCIRFNIECISQSASALEVVKKDLAEYTCTMQQDTSTMVAITRQKMRDQAEQVKTNS